MSAMKRSYSNVIATLKLVASSWAANNPNFVSNKTTPQALQALAQSLKSARDDKDTKTSTKRGCSDLLKTINSNINTKAKTLRHFIKGEYVDAIDINTILSQYGLVAHTPTPRLTEDEKKKLAEAKAAKKAEKTDGAAAPKATLVDAPTADSSATPAADKKKVRKPQTRYIIPSDNTERGRVIECIIRKLSEPNDPVGASRQRYVQEWIDIYDAHKAEWEKTSDTSAATAIPVKSSQELKEEGLEILKLLRLEIMVSCAKFGAASVTTLRSFGFLSEQQ